MKELIPLGDQPTPGGRRCLESAALSQSVKDRTTSTLHIAQAPYVNLCHLWI